MNIEERILEYLDRVERYICTPWGQRDPNEFKALMEMKADIYGERKCQSMHESIIFDC